MTAALGQEINEFYNHGIPGDAYTEETPEWLDACFNSNDQLALKPTDTYELNDFGYIIDADENIVAFEKAFLEWKDGQNTRYLLVSIPDNKIEDWQRLLGQNKWISVSAHN